MPPLQHVSRTLETLAPLALAESWDNVGLLLGDHHQPVSRVMTCLTITPEVVHEAIAQQANLIVSHHPVLFKPVQKLTSATADGQLLLPLARHGIAVYSAHTAYDNAPQGINQQLAERLGLQQIRPLIPSTTGKQFKVAVFVPEADADRVADAMHQAGAGIIGNYTHCHFRTTGTGSFLGNDNSNPTVGLAGQRESVSEVKLEVLCPSRQLSAVLAAMKAAHSYEEPAFDVYPLHESTDGKQGSGRVGELPSPLSATALGELVATRLGATITLTGHRRHESIRHVAIVCGAGGSLLQQAIAAGANAFLTGEIRFHDELAAQAAGITVIAAGHYATERPGIEQLARQLAQALPDCTVWASSAEQNPACILPCPTLPGSP